MMRHNAGGRSLGRALKWRRWVGLLAVLTVALGATLAQAQQTVFDRVTQDRGTLENPISEDLTDLQVGDEIEIELKRLSGNLVPFATLNNDTENRRTVRLRASEADPRYLSATYTVNEEAGAGRYSLYIFSDPDFGEQSTGDYILTYTVRRRGEILNARTAGTIPFPPEYDVPIILTTGETTLSGEISDDIPRVDYLVYLTDPLQVTLTRTDGDLELLLGISLAGEESFFAREFDDGTGAASVIFPPEEDPQSYPIGYYIVAAARDGVEEGDTTGTYELNIRDAPQPTPEVTAEPTPGVTPDAPAEPALPAIVETTPEPAS